MIINALLDVLNTLVSWLISVRPSWAITLPPSITSYCSWMLGYDAYLPISETLTIFSVVATLFSAMLAFRWGKWLVDSIIAVIP